jgi:hypothetical protein
MWAGRLALCQRSLTGFLWRPVGEGTGHIAFSLRASNGRAGPDFVVVKRAGAFRASFTPKYEQSAQLFFQPPEWGKAVKPRMTAGTRGMSGNKISEPMEWAKDLVH